MSFFSGKKSKEKEKPKEPKKEKEVGGKKSQFYVEFLGWMECRGVRGRRYTDPVIQELKRRQRKMDSPPKLTIQLTARELRISQDFEEKRKRAIKKVTFPPILARDVTYVVQAARPAPDGRLDDVVACIFLGYMPRTGRFVHVHVYRFDEPSTASTFAKLMGSLVAANLNRINEVERDLAEKGEIDDPGLSALSDGMSEHATTGTDSAAGSVSGSGGYSENGSPTFGSDDIDDDMDADLQSLNDVQPFDSVAEELKLRLRMRDAPLLLPPKDYDTISRARGNLLDINERRCLSLGVVGEGAVDQRPRNGSEESGIDLASPGSDSGGDVLGQFHAAAQAQAQARGAADVTPMPPPPPYSSHDELVYPPRQEPRSPAMSPALRRSRPSPQTSPFGTRSSRASHHSDGGNSSTERFPVYSRSNSSSSNTNTNTHPAPPHMAANLAESRPEEDEYVPPADYDDPAGAVMMRRGPPFPSATAASASASARPLSGTPLGGSPMLMRSLPAGVLQSEMALAHSPRAPRRGVDGDEYYLNAQRRSQPVYASHNLLDLRPRSAEVNGAGAGPRRVNSYR